MNFWYCNSLWKKIEHIWTRWFQPFSSLKFVSICIHFILKLLLIRVIKGPWFTLGLALSFSMPIQLWVVCVGVTSCLFPLQERMRTSMSSSCCRSPQRLRRWPRCLAPIVSMSKRQRWVLHPLTGQLLVEGVPDRDWISLTTQKIVLIHEFSRVSFLFNLNSWNWRASIDLSTTFTLQHVLKQQLGWIFLS